ncbi:6777_t:CDS:2 [Entrophospora sp. SA101]|nr:6777_t:CDS:2 [Entrophospora sp. SA101]
MTELFLSCVERLFKTSSGSDIFKTSVGNHGDTLVLTFRLVPNEIKYSQEDDTIRLIDWLKRIITEKRESYEFNDIIKELIDLIPKSSSPKKFSFGNYRSPSKFPLRDIDPKSVGRWKIDRVTLLEGWEKCIKDYEYEIINRCSTDVLVSRKMYQGAHVARRSQYDILFRNWSLKIVGVCSNTYNVIFG